MTTIPRNCVIQGERFTLIVETLAGRSALRKRPCERGRLRSTRDGSMADEEMEVEEKGGEGPRFVVKKWCAAPPHHHVPCAPSRAAREHGEGLHDAGQTYTAHGAQSAHTHTHN